MLFDLLLVYGVSDSKKETVFKPVRRSLPGDESSPSAEAETGSAVC